MFALIKDDLNKATHVDLLCIFPRIEACTIALRM